MERNSLIFIMLILSLTKSYGFKALFVSVSGAGHVTPMFELAKAMKNHNITFLTHKNAEFYIDLKSYSSPLFRTIYVNDSPDALHFENNLEQQMVSHFVNNSLLDVLPMIAQIMSEIVVSLLDKTTHILTIESFDVIVAGKAVFGIPTLCKQVNTPCVLQSPSIIPKFLDLNIPNSLSSLSSNDLTQIKYRIYNVVFSIRCMFKLIPQFISILYKIFQSLPKIPGPLYDAFSFSNLFWSDSKYLTLLTVPPTFHVPSYSDPYVKFLGIFINETMTDDIDNDLTRWVKSKSPNSIIYGAFGSTSLINVDRMYNLIHGLATFLLEVDNSYLLLALRSANYETYQSVVERLNNQQLKDILNDKQRVRIENGFVQQKWILQQKSVKIFLSHCGMNSILESLYFSKPILGIPYGMEQFVNAISIEHLGVGKLLFVPPSLWQSLIRPYDFAKYTFESETVVNNMLSLWTNEKYEKNVRLMSLEIKHVGGLKRAVEEIEFFVELQGDLDRFLPFQSTLPFYQRYTIDLLFIFIILPTIIICYVLRICCKRRKKQKTE